MELLDNSPTQGKDKLYKTCRKNLNRRPSDIKNYDFCDDFISKTECEERKHKCKTFTKDRKRNKDKHSHKNKNDDDSTDEQTTERSDDAKRSKFEVDVGIKSISSNKNSTDIDSNNTCNQTQEMSMVSNLFERGDADSSPKQIADLCSGFEPRPMQERSKRLIEVYPKVSRSDFENVKYLSRGAFGVVDLVRCKLNNQLYALKQLEKAEIARRNRIPHLMREKELMYKCIHRNCVRLENTFQDEDNCYFVLEYHPLGNLTNLIRKRKKLSRSLTRFYAKEIINALEYFRKFNIVHRDMKPENILIDENFHCKISDFGSAKIIDAKEVEKELSKVSFDFAESTSDLDVNPNFDLDSVEERYSQNVLNRGNTFIGTPLYVSPEMLAHNIACYASDLWGLGCIIYQCLTGNPPFFGQSESVVFDQILECKVEFPSDMRSDCKDLIMKLLQRNPKDRLGAGEKGSNNSLTELKSHEFFKCQTSPTSKFKRVYRKKPPVSSRLIEIINRENKEDSDDESILEINEEISPKVVIETRETKTLSKVENENIISVKTWKSQ